MAHIPPLRGRQAERAVLQEAWTDACAGKARFVIISGEPGSGKTRLVQELYRDLDRSHDPPSQGYPDGYYPALDEWGGGAGSLIPPMPDASLRRPKLPYLWWAMVCRMGNEGQRESFQPFADGIDQICWHILTQLHGHLRKEAWGEVLHGVVWGSMEFVPLLGPLLKGAYNPVRSLNARMKALRSPGKLDEKLLTRSSGAAASGGLEDVLIQLLAALNESQDKRLPEVPTCIILDDAQWADARSVVFSQRLLELASERRWKLLLIATARSDELAVLKGQPSKALANIASLALGLTRRCGSSTVRQLELAPDITAAEMRLLLTDQLPSASDKTIDMLLAHVGGHPYYAVNYARLIKENDWLDAQGEIPAQKLSTVPPEVSALIERRIELLSPDKRCALRWASVQGMRFTDEYIRCTAESLGLSKQGAMLSLDTLQSEHSLVARVAGAGDGVSIYEFTHRLVHEHVHASFDQRSQEYQYCTGALGEMLRFQLESQRLRNWPHHDQLLALQWLTPYALSKGNSPAQDASGWSDVHLLAATALLEMLEARGDYLQAEAPAQEVWAAQGPKWEEGEGRTFLLLRLYPLLTRVFQLRGLWDDWGACAAQWLKRSREAADIGSEIEALISLARLDLGLGAPAQAMQQYIDAEALAAGVDNQDQMARVMLGKGHVLLKAGQLDEALLSFEAARSMHGRVTDMHLSLEAKEGIAEVHRARVDLNAARIMFDDLLAEYGKLGDEHAVSRVLMSLADLARYESDFEGSQHFVDAALEVSDRIGDAVGLCTAQRMTAVIKSNKSDFEGALQALERSLVQAERIGDQRLQSGCQLSLGTTHMRMGKDAEAVPFLTKSLELCERANDKQGVAVALADLSLAHCKLRNFEEAIDLARKAERTFAEERDSYHVSFTATCEGFALMSLGRWDESIAASQRAHELLPDVVSHFNIAFAKWMRGDADTLKFYCEGLALYGKAPPAENYSAVFERGLADPAAFAAFQAEADARMSATSA